MKRTKSIAIVAAMTTLLSATAVYATTTSTSAVQIPKFSHSQSGSAHGGAKVDLESLVTAGTITQAQADAVQSALKPTKPTKAEDRASVWEGLVTAGTITQVQADAIKSAQEAGKPAGPSRIWESLVTAGTITQAQVDAIESALKPAKHADPTSILDGLVTAGTITQAQEEAIQGTITNRKMPSAR